MTAARLYRVAMAVGVAVPVLCALSFVVGHVTRQTHVHGLITRHSTRAHVEQMFHMGTDGVGRPEYGNMACAGKVCAWDYRGGANGKRWRVTLQLEEPKVAPPRYPRLADTRQ